jgi:long-chain fatty acid transport protein
VELHSPEAIVVATGIGIQSRFHDRLSQPPFGQPLGGEGGDAGAWSFVPSACIAAPITENFAVGFAVNAPFGLKLEYGLGAGVNYQRLLAELTNAVNNPPSSPRESSSWSRRDSCPRPSRPV